MKKLSKIIQDEWNNFDFEIHFDFSKRTVVYPPVKNKSLAVELAEDGIEFSFGLLQEELNDKTIKSVLLTKMAQLFLTSENELYIQKFSPIPCHGVVYIPFGMLKD